MKKRIDVNSETWQAIEEFLRDKEECIFDDLASNSSDWSSVLRLRGELGLARDLLELPSKQAVDSEPIDYN